MRLRSLTQIEEVILVIAGSTVGSRRGIGKSRASTNLDRLSLSASCFLISRILYKAHSSTN
jgi:hypothetical protein